MGSSFYYGFVIFVLIALFLLWLGKAFQPWDVRRAAVRKLKAKIKQDQVDEDAAQRMANKYRKNGRI